MAFSAIPLFAHAEERYTTDSGIVYTVTSNEATLGDIVYTACVVDYTGESDTVNIPKQILNGDRLCTVTGVGENAFYKDSITSVSIDGMNVSIEPYAFSDCEKLQSVVLKNVVKIGACAFENCTTLKNIDFGGSLSSIDDGAFGYCYALEQVNFPNSLLSVGEESFISTALKSVVIPKSVYEIGVTAFSDCMELSAISAEEGNSTFLSLNDILYTDGGKTVFFVPPAIESIVLSQEATAIGDRAFYENLAEEIFVPSGILSIGSQAFAYCTECVKISIADSVTSIDDDAFFGMNEDVLIYADKGSFAYNHIKSNYPEYTRINNPTSLNLSNTKVTLDKTEFICTKEGEVFTPSVKSVVSYGSEIDNKYYTVTYENNTGKGTGIVKFDFHGLYSGSVKVPFSIKGISIAGAKVAVSATSFTYNGKVQKPSVNSVSVGGSKIPVDDYTLTYSNSNSKTVNSYTVTVTAKKESVYDGSVAVTYYIKPVKVTSVKATTVSTGSVKVSWKRTATGQGITGVRIYCGSKLIKTVKGSTATAVTISGLKAGTAYSFKVFAYKTCSNKAVVLSAGSSVVKAATKPSKVSLKSLSSPKKKKLKVSWKKVTASGYQVAYSTKSSFKKANTKYVFTSSSSKTLSVKRGKKYYVKVRAYRTVNGKKVYGSWSGVKSKKSK